MSALTAGPVPAPPSTAGPVPGPPSAGPVPVLAAGPVPVLAAGPVPVLAVGLHGPVLAPGAMGEPALAGVPSSAHVVAAVPLSHAVPATVGPLPLVAALLVIASAVALAAATRARRAEALRRRAAVARGAPPVVERPGPRHLALALGSAGLAWPAGLVWDAWRLLVPVAAVLGAVVGGPTLGVVAALAAAGGPAVALAALRGRGDRLAESAMPDVLEAVARSLRTGASLRQALEEAQRAAPPVLAGDLVAVQRAVGNGVPLLAALDAWPERRPLPAVRLAVAALGLGAETGGAQARAIDGVAATVRGRLSVQAEVHALASQARASAMVIGLAPVGFAALAVATDDHTADFLLRSGPGAACLVVGLALDAVAALWMRRATRVEA